MINDQIVKKNHVLMVFLILIIRELVIKDNFNLYVFRFILVVFLSI